MKVMQNEEFLALKTRKDMVKWLAENYNPVNEAAKYRLGIALAKGRQIKTLHSLLELCDEFEELSAYSHKNHKYAIGDTISWGQVKHLSGGCISLSKVEGVVFIVHPTSVIALHRSKLERVRTVKDV